MKATPRKTRRWSDDYSDRWKAQYGKTLTRDDIRLVQAFRGLSASKRTALLEDASLAVIASVQEPPAGLVAAFAMAKKHDETAIAAHSTAAEVYPIACEIISLLHARRDYAEETEGHQDLLIEKALERVMRKRYADVLVNHPPSDYMASDVAFDVGFAVCWLLLTSVNGGAR